MSFVWVLRAAPHTSLVFSRSKNQPDQNLGSLAAGITVTFSPSATMLVRHQAPLTGNGNVANPFLNAHFVSLSGDGLRRFLLSFFGAFGNT